MAPDDAAYQDNPYGTVDPATLFQQLTQQNQNRGAMGQISQGTMQAGFNPAMQRATTIQNNLQAILAGTPAEEGEDPLDTQIRQARAVATGMLRVDPQTAMRASQQLLRLEQAQKQQASLSAETEGRQAATRAQQIKNIEAQNTPMAIYEQTTDPKTGLMDFKQYGTVPVFEDDGTYDPAKYHARLTAALNQAKTQGATNPMFKMADQLSNDKMLVAGQQANARAFAAMMNYRARIDSATITANGPDNMDQATKTDAAIQSAYDPHALNNYVRGNRSNAVLQDIANIRTQWQQQMGLTSEDMAGFRANVKAQTGNMQKLVANLGQLDVADGLVRSNVNQVMALIQDVDETGVPAIEGLRRKLAASSGGHLTSSDNMLVNQLQSVLQTAIPEIARVTSGNPNMTGVLSHQAMEDIQRVVQGNLDAPSMVQILKRLEGEIEFKRSGYIYEIDSSRKAITTGQTSASPQMPAMPSGPPPGQAPPSYTATEQLKQPVEATATSVDGKTKLFRINGQWYKDAHGAIPYAAQGR